MSRKSKFSLGVCLMFALAASTALYAGKYNKVINIGDPMPGFSNLPSTNGKNYSSGDFEEDIMVLVFLANHCPWVKGGDADLVKIVDLFKGKNVRFVGVSVNHREDDRLPAMIEHATKAGYNFVYLFDESQELGRALGATRTPEFYVFNKDRKLVYTGLLHNSPASMGRNGSVRHVNGDPKEFYAKDAIEATLAGKSVMVSETAARGCNVEYEQK